MKYLSSIVIAVILTGCAVGPRLTKADLKYFPSETLNIATDEECNAVKHHLDQKFPKELNRNDGKKYWLDATTQKAYRLSNNIDRAYESESFINYDTGCSPAHRSYYNDAIEYKLEVISFYELAEQNFASKQSKRKKQEFFEQRINRLGIN